MLRTLKLTIAYDGTDFCGWQVQTNGRSVQADLEAAWLKITGESIRITASGRTDSGVHAVGQVAGLTTGSKMDCKSLRRAINASLNFDVRVLAIEPIEDGFHAIRDATSKRYRYLIQDGRIRDPFMMRTAWWVPHPLDLAPMQEACGHLRGLHDFAAFESKGSPRQTTERTVTRLDITRRQSELVPFLELNVEADGFLYNMVRNIVGTLVEIGRNKQTADWPAAILATGDRRHAGPTAPAVGLCLVNVEY